MTSKIKLWKKYASGEVKPLTINETSDNVQQMLSHGFFLTEAEAKSGKIEEDKPKPKRGRKPKVVSDDGNSGQSD